MQGRRNAGRKRAKTDEEGFRRGFDRAWAQAQHPLAQRRQRELMRRIAAEKKHEALVAHLRAKNRALRERQRERAKRPRKGDPLTRLLRRTVAALRREGRPTGTRTVIGALGQHDTDNVLAAPPGAVGLYGRSPDPKRTYFDRAARRIWYRDGEVKSVSLAALKLRLVRVRRIVSRG